MRGTTLMAVSFDMDRLSVIGDALPVLEGISLDDWAVSRTGTLAYIPSGGATPFATLVWMNREGRVLGSALSQPIENPMFPRLSPDGARLALISGASGSALSIHDLDGRPPLPLFQQGVNSDPVWSPDGRYVAFASGESGRRSVYWMPSDGSAQEPQQVDSGVAIANPDAWLADGQLLLTARVPGAEWDIRVAPVASGPPRDVVATKDFEKDATPSPDGRWFAYESNRSGRPEIWGRALSGGAAVRLSENGGKAPVWSRDGRELFYIQDDKLMAIAVTPGREGLAFKTAVELFALPRVLFGEGLDGSSRSYDVAPDGRFLVIQPTPLTDPAPASIVVVQNWVEELKRLVPTR
jgi:Tol biopolymer transport system component